MVRRIAVAVATAAAVMFGVGPAMAGNGHGQEKTTICHPVASATGGNTHAGYSIITTANPSVHIDEETGLPKHNFDGRVDFVVDENHPCPPEDTTEPPCPTGTQVQGDGCVVQPPSDETVPPGHGTKPPKDHDGGNVAGRSFAPRGGVPVTGLTALESVLLGIGLFLVLLGSVMLYVTRPTKR